MTKFISFLILLSALSAPSFQTYAGNPVVINASVIPPPTFPPWMLTHPFFGPIIAAFLPGLSDNTILTHPTLPITARTYNNTNPDPINSSLSKSTISSSREIKVADLFPLYDPQPQHIATITPINATTAELIDPYTGLPAQENGGTVQISNYKKICVLAENNC